MLMIENKKFLQDDAIRCANCANKDTNLPFAPLNPRNQSKQTKIDNAQTCTHARRFLENKIRKYEYIRLLIRNLDQETPPVQRGRPGIFSERYDPDDLQTLQALQTETRDEGHDECHSLAHRRVYARICVLKKSSKSLCYSQNEDHSRARRR